MKLAKRLFTAMAVVLLVGGIGFAGEPNTVTVMAEPLDSGLEVIVDGNTYSTPHAFAWVPGSIHTIDAASPQPDDAVGTKYVFNSWSDGGNQSHEIIADAGMTLTASFDTWHQLTVSVGPPGAETYGCSVVFYPQGEGDPWFREGTLVQLTANPGAYWRFVQWHDGDTNPVRNISMDGPGSYTMQFALLSPNPVAAWGKNNGGELGDGTTTLRCKPVHVHNLTEVIAIAGGKCHSLAVKVDGTVWASGWNSTGQLGDNTTTERHEAVQVHNLTDVLAIAAGDRYSLAVKADGTVWAWG